MAEALRASPTDAAHANAPTAGNGRTTFDLIYAEHFPYVWRCLRGLGVPDAALDDAVQDVFVVVHRQLGGFQGRSTIRTWLFGILRNVASNHRRSAHRKDLRHQPMEANTANPEPDPLERAQNAEAAAFMQTFLARLNEKKREVFILAVIEEMSIPEVATMLSIRLNTAYTRLRGARTEFYRALSKRR